MDLRVSILKAQVARESDRHSRLGLETSLAFAHFVWLYRKYDSDQPRDEMGRWTETGVDDDLTTGTSSRAAEIRESMRIGFDVPIIRLSVRRGSAVKTLLYGLRSAHV